MENLSDRFKMALAPSSQQQGSDVGGIGTGLPGQVPGPGRLATDGTTPAGEPEPIPVGWPPFARHPGQQDQPQGPRTFVQTISGQDAAVPDVDQVSAGQPPERNPHNWLTAGTRPLTGQMP